MKKCERCGKPLSQFEVKFHAEAGSPDTVRGQCWVCSKADEAFAGADVKNKGHKKQINYCLLGLVAIFVAFLPLMPYLDEYDLPILLNIYSKLVVILYIAIGAFVSYPILLRVLDRRKESVLRVDPPEQRYGTRYTPETTHYEGRERFDGTIVVNKVTRGGAVQVDRWEWYGTSNEKVNGILGLYGTLVEKIIYVTVLIFMGAAFAFWAIPYIIYAVLKDKKTAEKRAKIPAALQKAYKTALSTAEPMPLTYHDKVGFLVSRENCRNAPQKSAGDSFLSNFKEAEKRDARLPFYFKRYNGVAYMIVDYKEGSITGKTFVLVKEKNAPIEKRIVVGNAFADADPADWASDWSALGVSAQKIGYVGWYEEKMESLLKDSRKEILG